jgi:hypothetical protein
VAIEALNGLPMKEYGALVATYWATYDSRFNCHECLTNYRGHAQRVSLVERDRFTKGCHGPEDLIKRAMLEKKRTREEAEAVIGWPLGGIKFLRCPGNFRTDWAQLVFRSWSAWRLGIQPVPGGLGALPSRTYEAFAVLDSLEAERMAKEKERAEKPRAGDGGKPDNNRRSPRGRTGK